jgi:hypothetical protein
MSSPASAGALKQDETSASAVAAELPPYEPLISAESSSPQSTDEPAMTVADWMPLRTSISGVGVAPVTQGWWGDIATSVIARVAIFRHECR